MSSCECDGLQPHLHPRKLKTRKAAITPTGQPPFLAADILKAYNISSSNLTGAGETIAIIIDAAPLPGDLTQFWSDNNVPQSLNRSAARYPLRCCALVRGEL